MGTIDKSEPIGFVGLGQMGGPMVRHLVRQGYTVIVHDRNPAAVMQAAEAGAHAASSLRELAGRARVVGLCLNSQQAALDVAFGDGGLAWGDRVETLIDFSTTGTDFAADFGQRLRERRGIALLDAPISGNVRTAGNGGLATMCSGPISAFRRVEPILRDLAHSMVLYLGERNGTAQRLKGLNNLISSTGSAIASELFVLGVKWGLAPEAMLEVLNAGDASCNATRNKFGKDVLTRRFAYGAHIEITAKDIGNTVREAEDLGVPMWVGQSVRELWHHAHRQGGGKLDGTALITFIEAWAGGVEVRHGANAEAAEAPQEPAPLGEVIVVCDERVRATIAHRLPGCAVVGLPAGGLARDLLAAVGPAGTGVRTVVNLCAMPTAQSVELAQALDGCVDAALTGAASDVAQGRGLVLVSASAARFEGLKPRLEPLGARTLRISGRPGAAHLMGLIDRCMADVLLAAACEAYVVGARAGIDPLDMVKILGVETGRTTASAHILPTLVAERRFDVGRPIGNACDELAMLSAEARALGVTTWLLDKLCSLYDLAARLGTPHEDVSRLAQRYEQWAGVEIRAGLGRLVAQSPNGASASKA